MGSPGPAHGAGAQQSVGSALGSLEHSSPFLREDPATPRVCSPLSGLTSEPYLGRLLPRNSLAGLTLSFRCPFRESGSSSKPSFLFCFVFSIRQEKIQLP